MTAELDRKAVFVASRRERPEVVAYGVAHAGAGAAAWRPVAQRLSERNELRGIRLPGRENRITVPVHTDMDSAVAELVAVVEADSAAHGLPVVLVGSCFGALVAAAAASRLPATAVVAIRQPVPSQLTATPAAMNSADFRQWLIDYKLTPSALLGDETFELFEPILRADLSLIEGYAVPAGSLTCPVHLVDSPFTAAEPELAQWSRVTSARVALTRLEVPGDPLTEHPDVLATVLDKILSVAQRP